MMNILPLLQVLWGQESTTPTTYIAIPLSKDCGLLPRSMNMITIYSNLKPVHGHACLGCVGLGRHRAARHTR